MSHTMNIKLEMRDLNALEQTCERLGLRHEVGAHRLYGSTETGFGVYLPGWRYPVVINTETGEARYDNYNGTWGKERELTRLEAYYGATLAANAAGIQGYMVEEEDLENEIRLTINIPD